jgi:hypothetical protein
VSSFVPVTTRADAIAAFYASKSWDRNGGDLTLCDKYIDAVRFLLGPAVIRSRGTGSDEVEFDISGLKDGLKKAEQWRDAYIARNSTNRSALRFADLNHFRS